MRPSGNVSGRGGEADLDRRGRRSVRYARSTRRLRVSASVASAGGNATAAAARRRRRGRSACAGGRPVIAEARAVEREDAAVGVGGDQAAQQAVDDVLVERAQILDLVTTRPPGGAGRAQALGQRPGQQRDGEEAEQVDGHRVLREARRRQRRVGAQAASRRKRRRASRYCAETMREIEHRAQRRHLQRPAAEADRARGDDRQQIERREVAGDAAGDVDERGHQHRVDRELQVDQPRAAVDERSVAR